MPSTQTIAVVDYGMGNLRSVVQALKHAAPDSHIILSSDPKEIISADKVVFPGQGAMPDCVRELKQGGLEQAVRYAAAHKPFLGICIGLQMLFEHSEEGDAAGLGILQGQVKRFIHPLVDAQGEKLKVPHMGWNTVQQRKPHPLWQHIPQDAHFYYVHSYYVIPNDSQIVAATSQYPKEFCCAIAEKNLFAVQFHPEKSDQHGLQLLRNFAQWDGQA